MWLIPLRDLQWRHRRFVLGAVATAVVFTLTLLLGGVGSALRGEADRAVQAVGADAWLVREGASGPFHTLAAMPDTVVDQVARAPGVVSADPFVAASATTGGARTVDVTVIGYRPGGLGPPVPTAGRQPSRPNEALVDRSTGYAVGDTVNLSGINFAVVGQVEHMTMRGGAGNVYLNIRDAQSVLFKGNRFVTAVLVRGAPEVPAALGLRVLDTVDARSDALRPVDQQIDAAHALRLLLWAAAILVVGATVHLAAAERPQDLAVLKALGASTSTLAAGLALQAVVVSVAAAGVAVLAAPVFAPVLPLPTHFSLGSTIGLVAIAAVVGMLAGLAGLSRAVRVEAIEALDA